MDLQPDLDAHDAKFAAWQAKNPGKPFSVFSAGAIASGIKKGRPHASLGPAIINAEDWRADGISAFEEVLRAVDLPTDTKVCDYGCGSMRVGLHFIERQAAGCYFGIDVTEDFIAYGRQLIGADLLASKEVKTGAIPVMLPEVVAADIDMLFNLNVASHVHPDEFETFISNMLAICHRPGSAVVIHAISADKPQRFQRSGWARTIDQYVEAMSPMRLERSFSLGPSERNGVQLETPHADLPARLRACNTQISGAD